MFYRLVDYSPWLASSGIPSAMPEVAGGAREAGSKVRVLRQRLRGLLGQLRQVPAPDSAARLLWGLYDQVLQLKALGVFDQEAPVEALLRRYRQALTKPQMGLTAAEGSQTAGEVAMLIEVEELIRGGDYEAALGQALTYEADIWNGDNRVALFELESILYQRMEAYEDALAALDAAEAIPPTPEREAEYTPPDNDPIRALIAEKMAEAAGQGQAPVTARHARSGQGRASAKRLGATGLSGTIQQQAPAADLPAAYALEEAYPNPFNPVALVPFALPAASHVQIMVYDMLGRRVATLVDAPYGAGRHEAVFDGSMLPSGRYLVRAVLTSEAEIYRFTRMLLLMK